MPNDTKIGHSTGAAAAAAMPLFPVCDLQQRGKIDFNIIVGMTNRLADMPVPTAVQTMEAAAKKGNVEAQFNLARHYSESTNPIDMKKAFEWYQKAAEQGDVAAENNLAVCHVLGKGTPKDEKTGFALHQKSAAKGLATAQDNLGACYGNAIGTIKNNALSFYWHQKAAAQNLASAQNNLALCYFHGKGVAKDEEKAFALFKQASAQGDLNAKFNLGACYAKGISTQKDEKQALLLLQDAANQGHCDAQYSLGCGYEEGIDTKVVDRKLAHEWFHKAAQQNHAKAQKKLNKFYCLDFFPGRNANALNMEAKNISQQYQVTYPQALALSVPDIQLGLFCNQYLNKELCFIICSFLVFFPQQDFSDNMLYAGIKHGALTQKKRLEQELQNYIAPFFSFNRNYRVRAESFLAECQSLEVFPSNIHRTSQMLAFQLREGDEKSSDDLSPSSTREQPHWQAFRNKTQGDPFCNICIRYIKFFQIAVKNPVANTSVAAAPSLQHR